MRSKSNDHSAALSGLRELDRIVLQVLRAIRHASVEEPERRDAAREQIEPDENVIYSERWQPRDEPGEPSVDDQLPSWENAPDAQPEYEVDDALPDMTDFGPEPAEGEEDGQGPLQPVEREFVRRTVHWLQRRPNRDILMDQIWRGLMAEGDNGEEGGDVSAPDDATPPDGPEAET